MSSIKFRIPQALNNNMYICYIFYMPGLWCEYVMCEIFVLLRNGLVCTVIKVLVCRNKITLFKSFPALPMFVQWIYIECVCHHTPINDTHLHYGAACETLLSRLY